MIEIRVGNTRSHSSRRADRSCDGGTGHRKRIRSKSLVIDSHERRMQTGSIAGREHNVERATRPRRERRSGSHPASLRKPLPEKLMALMVRLPEVDAFLTTTDCFAESLPIGTLPKSR